MLYHSCSELNTLISILRDGDPTEKNIEIMQDKYFQAVFFKLSSEEEEQIRKVTLWLEEDLVKKDARYVDLRPYISIILSYAYFRLNLQQQALDRAVLALSQFNRFTNQWNRGISHWFLGIVLRSYGQIIEARRELVYSIDILKRYVRFAEQNYNYHSRDLCRAYIDRIERTIDELLSLQMNSNQAYQLTTSYAIISGISKWLRFSTENSLHELLKEVFSLEPFMVDLIQEKIFYLKSLIESQYEGKTVNVPLITRM